MTMHTSETAPLPYYSFDKIMSFNAPWNMVCGARGLGKTYGATRDAVKAFTRTGEQFIYLRRFKSELDARVTFFSEIGEEFPEWDFRINGMVGEAARVDTRDDQKREWHTVCYFMALTQAQSKKSQNFIKVTRIIFDEFIIEKGHTTYIQGFSEAKIFQNFYNTVDRYKNKTKVFFLSNSVALTNPYFLHYQIEPDSESEFVKRGKGFLVAHFVESKHFQNAVYESAFGKFLREFDPEYAQYAVENAFHDNHDELVRPKNPDAKYRYTLETVQGSFSIWKETLGGRYYAQAKRPKRETVFTMIRGNVSEKKSLILTSDELLRKLRTAWRTGNMHFDSKMTRNMFTEIFK